MCMCMRMKKNEWEIEYACVYFFVIVQRPLEWTFEEYNVQYIVHAGKEIG